MHHVVLLATAENPLINRVSPQTAWRARRGTADRMSARWHRGRLPRPLSTPQRPSVPVAHERHLPPPYPVAAQAPRDARWPVRRPDRRRQRRHVIQ